MIRYTAVIILTLAASLTSLCGRQATGQVRVTGTVVAAQSGTTLAAAHVQIQNTSRGTITNEAGQFELIVPSVPVTLEIRYIGFRTETVLVDANSTRGLFVELVPSPVELKEIVVSGVDRAEQIMREVGRRKRALRDTLQSSSATAYSRLTLSSGGELQLIRETVWDEYYSLGRGKRNVVRSFRETSELYKAFDIVPAASLVNFYDDLIPINGLSFVGPTHPDAEATYEFTLGSTRMVDTLRAYEIFVAPRSPIKPSFIGTITVVDSLYTLAEVDLRPARHVEFPAGFESWRVEYRQHFARVSGDVWFPVDLVAEGRIARRTRDQDFISAYFTEYARLSDHQLGGIVPDEPFRNDALVQIDSASVFEDYLFMRGYNIIPLTPREEEAFLKLRQDPHRLASVFRERPHYDALSFIRPRKYRRDGPQFVFPTIRGYIPTFRFNRVDGLVSGIGQEGALSDRTRLAWGIGQSSGAGEIRYRLELDQKIVERTRIGFLLYRDSQAIARSPIYSEAVASLPSLAGRGDYFDYSFSRRVALSITQEYDVVRMAVGGYVDRDAPMEREIGRSWPWGSIYRPNPATPDSGGVGLTFSVKVGDSFQPYHLDARTLVVEAEQGLDPQFSRLSAIADFRIPTLFRGTIRPNRLDVRVIAGALLGDSPLQRLGGLDGAMLGFGTIGVFRSLRDRQVVGDRWAAIFVDHDFGAVLFDALRMRALSESRTGIHVFGAVGVIDIRSDNREAESVYGSGGRTRAEVGVSLSNILGSRARLDGGTRLDGRGYFFGFGFGNR